MSEPTTNETAKSGIGIFGVAAFATVLLGALKFFGLVEMSWLIVFMPLLVALGLTALGLFLGLLLIGVVLIAKALSKE